MNFKEWKKGDKLILLLVAGILMVILAWPGESVGEESGLPESGLSQGRSSGAESAGISGSAGIAGAGDSSSYAHELEKRLVTILSGMEGVGAVEVMITLKTSEEKVFQTNRESSVSLTEETDSSGGTRRQEEQGEKTDTLTSGGSGDPYVIREIMPRVEGVVVLADGGGQATVKSEIIGAVEALFDLEPHKIKVLKRGS